jgi:hypothetical protein
VLAGESSVDPAFEREKWEAEVRLRERELAIKEAEAAANAKELARSRWENPIVLAVFAAAIAAGGSAAVALINGIEQRAADERHAKAEIELQTSKASEEQRLEEGKAEAARILEMIKTNDPDKAAVNLAFLVDTGLIVGEDRRKSLAAYLKQRQAGQGPTLPVNTPVPFDVSLYYGYTCQIKDGKDWSFVANSVAADLSVLRQDIDIAQNLPGRIDISYKHLMDASAHPAHGFILVQDNGPGQVIVVPGLETSDQAAFPLLNSTLANTLRRLAVNPRCSESIGPVKVKPQMGRP